MIQLKHEQNMAAPTVLAGWINRAELAGELGVSVDSSGRWEGRRIGRAVREAGIDPIHRHPDRRLARRAIA